MENNLSPKIALFSDENIIIDLVTCFSGLCYQDCIMTVSSDIYSFREQINKQDSDIVVIDFKHFKRMHKSNILPEQYAGDWLIINVPNDYEYPCTYWIDMGFSGLLYQRDTVDDIFRAIKATYEKGQLWFSRNELAKALRNYMKSGVSHEQLSEHIACKYHLTPKETDICSLMLSGLTNSQIAIQKNVSIYTVKNHVSRIMSKLNISSRKELLEKSFLNSVTCCNK